MVRSCRSPCSPVRAAIFCGSAFLSSDRLRAVRFTAAGRAAVSVSEPAFGRDLAVRDVRRFGAAALDLAYVAAGRFDGFWERGLGKWDMAAGTLFITEAGGMVSDADGGPAPLATGGICAANLDLHPLILERLRAAA